MPHNISRTQVDTSVSSYQALNSPSHIHSVTRSTNTIAVLPRPKPKQRKLSFWQLLLLSTADKYDLKYSTK